MLVIVYIGGTHIYQNMTAGNREKNINIEKLWSVRSDIGADGLDSGRLLPETIGYRLAGADPVGCIADRESIEELYGRHRELYHRAVREYFLLCEAFR